MVPVPVDLPIVDVHMHSYASIPPDVGPPVWADRPEAKVLSPARSPEDHFAETLEEMDRNNVVRGVVSGPHSSVIAWHEGAPGRFIGGAFLGDDGMPEHSVEELEALVRSGTIGVLGELALQYEGLAPDDPRLDVYYEFLERSGTPLALHTGLGPPGGPHTFAPRFRANLGRPLLFEPVIAPRPKLNAYLMHAGWPFVDEITALMYVYPNLYVDIGVLAWAITVESFYRVLQTLLDSGFEDRIMFGTDQMFWPGAISLAVETVRAAPFLNHKATRAIFYDNAIRFFDHASPSA